MNITLTPCKCTSQTKNRYLEVRVRPRRKLAYISTAVPGLWPLPHQTAMGGSNEVNDEVARRIPVFLILETCLYYKVVVVISLLVIRHFFACSSFLWPVVVHRILHDVAIPTLHVGSSSNYCSCLNSKSEFMNQV